MGTTAPDAPRSGSLEERFADLARRYGAAIDRLSRGYERSDDLRRDLRQEILVALWRALPAFEGRCSERTWVHRIGHNVAATHCIRMRRSRAAAWTTLEELASLAAPGDGEALAGDREQLERLAELIRRLSPLDRQLVLLFLEGLEPAEIAEVTGLSTTNVTTKTSRIRAALRAGLDRRVR